MNVTILAGKKNVVLELVAIAKYLGLDISEDINAQNMAGTTALMLAVAQKDLGLLKILFEAGADLDIPATYRHQTISLLAYAEFEGSEKIADFIRKRSSTQ